MSEHSRVLQFAEVAAATAEVWGTVWPANYAAQLPDDGSFEDWWVDANRGCDWDLAYRRTSPERLARLAWEAGRKSASRVEVPEPDLSACPYYQGTGKCSFGCSREPSCITDRPLDGWPSERQ